MSWVLYAPPRYYSSPLPTIPAAFVCVYMGMGGLDTTPDGM